MFPTTIAPERIAQARTLYMSDQMTATMLGISAATLRRMEGKPPRFRRLSMAQRLKLLAIVEVEIKKRSQKLATEKKRGVSTRHKKRK